MAAVAAGRDPSEIEVIAVTKTRSPQEVSAVIAAGALHVGENRLQEAAAKRREVSAFARWHFIGHLQTKKAKGAAELFDLIQSIDDERRARTYRRAGTAGERAGPEQPEAQYGNLSIETRGKPTHRGGRLGGRAAGALAAGAGRPGVHPGRRLERQRRRRRNNRVRRKEWWP